MAHFTELEAWKIGLDLLEEIYMLTKKLPKEELFGMSSQMKRASASILANIAEGCGRYTYPDKAAKFTIARGESYEVGAFVIAIAHLKFVSSGETVRSRSLIDHEQKLLSGLIASCKKKIEV